MGRKLYVALSAVMFIAAVAVGVGAVPAAVDMCSSLLSNSTLRALPNTTITSAATVRGSFTPPGAKQAITGLPSFCRVEATLKPSPASDIKVEVWMPTTGWNGKLEGIGNSGLAGSIVYSTPPEYVAGASMADAIKRGYAAVGTDTGHVASDTSWLANEDKEKDYGYRAIHEMTGTAKAAVQDFYGKPAAHSYFNGCSTGGGQALGESQLYPDDYDGILAGSPQNYETHSRLFDLWEYQLVNKTNPPVKLPKATLAMVTQAVMNRCGGDNGANKEGFFSASDPRDCWFGAEELLCAPGDDPSTCLTADQVHVIFKLYGLYILPETNTEILPGLPVGSEGPSGPGAVGWAGRPYLNGGASLKTSAAALFYSLGVLGDPNVDLAKVDLAAAVKIADQKFPYINHISTDLDAFRQSGHKLLIYHGWDDPDISIYNTIDYYSAVVDAAQRKDKVNHAAALEDVEKSVRFFAVPGMGHCGGGPGPTSFDPLATLDQWVDKGVAPDKIDASHVTKGVKTFTRPVCPYPQSEIYNEKGDMKDPANWVCGKEHWNFALYDRYFYAPDLTPSKQDRPQGMGQGRGQTE